MELQAQYATAILMSGAGAILGAVYDIYRTSLKEWRFLRRFSALFDIAFWLFALIMVFTMLLGANDGDVRLVVFVLLAIGYTVYRLTVHPLVVGSTRMVIRFIQRVLYLCYRGFLIIVIQPIVFVVKAIAWVFSLIDRGLGATEPVIVWPFQTLAYRPVKKYLVPIVLRWKDKYIGMSNKYINLFMGWFRRPPDDSGET